MNVIARARTWAARKAYQIGGALSLTDPSHAAGWQQILGGARTYAGKSVDEVSAMQASAVFGCVRGISESAATLPVAVYEKDKNGNAIAVDHPLDEILSMQPNADMVDVDYRESKFANMALQGNGYSLTERRGDGNVSSLYPLAANCVKPQRNRDSGELEYRVNDRGRWETYPREKIWHIRGFGSNGLVGYSPIGLMRQAIGLALATEEFGARFFSQGAITSGVVTVPSFLTAEQRVTAREVLQQKYEGLGNAHKLMLLEGGMTYAGVSMNLDDAEYLLLRGFQIDEIARIYRYPPHMLAKLDRATFSNIEQQAIEFAVYCLAPYLVRFERSAARWLLKPADRRRFFVRFNMEGLLRGDSDMRQKFYSSMLQNGVYSRNEVRALENRNRIEGQGMDDYTVQSNMIDVNDLAKLLVGKAAAPDPAPAPKSVSSVLDIKLSPMQETADSIADALRAVKDSQQSLAEAVGDLAVSHDGLHEATVTLARETARTAKRMHETNDKIERGLSGIAALHARPRKAVYDKEGNVVGVEIVETLQ